MPTKDNWRRSSLGNGSQRPRWLPSSSTLDMLPQAAGARSLPPDLSRLPSARAVAHLESCTTPWPLHPIPQTLSGDEGGPCPTVTARPGWNTAWGRTNAQNVELLFRRPWAVTTATMSQFLGLGGVRKACNTRCIISGHLLGTLSSL